MPTINLYSKGRTEKVASFGAKIVEVKPTGTHSSRRINRLAQALDSRTYLEIGVANGVTFMNVDIPSKVAVDPNFNFDYHAAKREGIEFFNMTSDDFFCIPQSRQFDIIFLDGLHTHQQTFRDFCASQVFSGPKTVWILDDTFPSDVYSTWPQQSEAINFRRIGGGQGVAWHGDVFRVVYLIRDFFPTYRYCTINTGGNPQTIVWKKPRANWAPKYNSLEAISRIDYFTMLQNMDVFEFYSEQKGIDIVIESILEKS